MRASADPVVLEPTAPPVRIRYLGLIGLIVAVASVLYPRMGAAFRLHSAATAFADYALCMVGPTGPSLLRDNPAEFRKLSRRKLVASPADLRPFARCGKGARDVTGSVEVERAHHAAAASFAEYGLAAPGSLVTRLDDLAVTTRPLSELAESAFPFVRGGYMSLIAPSAYAAEAPHPAELPRPGIGTGPVPSRATASCLSPEAGDRGPRYVLGLGADRRTLLVRSLTPEGITSDATLGPAEARVLSVSCDARALVAAVGRPSSKIVTLMACAHLGSCAPMPLPRFGKDGPEPEAPLDVARVDGVTVVAVARGGIVRVASSRDQGRTWTPFTVAFDAEAHPEVSSDVKVPDRLHAAGHRVLLYGEPRRAQGTFPLLVSDDAGASFHAP